ncbi:unnamed protein product, partial [Symbiodinium sp. CCMP2456]
DCGIPTGIRVYTAVVRLFRAGGRWPQALALLPQMAATLTRPDLIFCSTTMSTCERGSAWEAALALLKDTSRNELQVDVILYSAAIGACAKGQQWQQSLALLDQLLEMQLRSDVIVFNTAISACAKSGQWQAALSCRSNSCWGPRSATTLASALARRPDDGRRVRNYSPTLSFFDCGLGPSPSMRR